MTTKTTSASEARKVEFMHPLCHYINGERLYYALLSVKTHVFEIGNQIVAALKESELQQSSCGYYLFGASDILLRVWGSEERIARFKKELTLIKDINREVDFMLISSMETWYQRRIEAKPNWASVVTEESFQSILAGEVPPELRFPAVHVEKRLASKKLIRYFIFVRDDSGKNKTLMSDLRARFSAKGEKLFIAKHRISLYSTYSPSFAGLLIKGETIDFPAVAPLLVAFAQQQKDLQRFTTTFICSSKLKDEANSLCEPGRDKTPRSPRKGDILWNLLISEGCNEEIMQEVPARIKAGKHFVSKFNSRVEHFFYPHSEWWSYTKDFRFLFKWCVMEDNDQLHAYLMRHFARIEHELREILWPLYSAEKRNDESEHLDLLVKKLKSRIGGLFEPDQRPDKASATDQVEAILREVVGPALSTLKALPQVSQVGGVATAAELEEEQRRHLTLGTITSFIKVLKKRIEGDKDVINDFAEALHDCSTQRNLIAHGSLQNLTMPNQQADSFPWELPVVSYMRLMLLRPRAVEVIVSHLSKMAAGSSVDGKRNVPSSEID